MSEKGGHKAYLKKGVMESLLSLKYVLPPEKADKGVLHIANSRK